jgi:hypothetical protein
MIPSFLLGFLALTAVVSVVVAEIDRETLDVIQRLERRVDLLQRELDRERSRSNKQQAEAGGLVALLRLISTVVQIRRTACRTDCIFARRTPCTWCMSHVCRFHGNQFVRHTKQVPVSEASIKIIAPKFQPLCK